MSKMIKLPELQAQLKTEYGPVIAQNITNLICAYEEGGPRTMDCLALIQLSELARSSRKDIKDLIRDIRMWDNMATLLAYNSIPIEQKNKRAQQWLEEDRHAAEILGFAENLRKLEKQSGSWEAISALMKYNRDLVESKLITLQERFEQELRLSRRLWRDFLILHLSYLKRYGQPVNTKVLSDMMDRARQDSAQDEIISKEAA